MIRSFFCAMASIFLGMPVFGAEAPFVIQPDDVITITVYGHDDLTRDVVVLRDGTINYPIIGSVKLSGKTTAEASETVRSGLKGEFRDPQVTISVKQPALRLVYVSGMVSKAGSYDLKPGWHVSHLIAEAGGLTSRAEMAKASLVRNGKAIPIDLHAILVLSKQEEDEALAPGDLLQIQPDTNLIHVAGQVKQPGDYQLKENLGILEAVTMAGGTSETAALTRAQVIRGATILKVDLRAVMVEGKMEGNVKLLPGDTIVVPANEARIAVLGGVQQPGYYDLPDGKAITLADALGLARGASKRAKLGKVALVRMADGQQVVNTLDLSRFLKNGDSTQNPILQAGDVIYVTDGSNIEPSNVLSAITSVFSPLLYSLFR